MFRASLSFNKRYIWIFPVWPAEIVLEAKNYPEFASFLEREERRAKILHMIGKITEPNRAFEVAEADLASYLNLSPGDLRRFLLGEFVVEISSAIEFPVRKNWLTTRLETLHHGRVFVSVVGVKGIRLNAKAIGLWPENSLEVETMGDGRLKAVAWLPGRYLVRWDKDRRGKDIFKVWHTSEDPDEVSVSVTHTWGPQPVSISAPHIETRWGSGGTFKNGQTWRWILHPVPAPFYRGGTMRYILNSAVITSPGRYEYKLISLEEAKAWLRGGDWESTIGYPETAAVLERLTGVSIPVNRKIIRMEPGDEALVFRLVFPPGTPRLDPTQKGMVSEEFLLEHCEIGLLRRED